MLPLEKKITVAIVTKPYGNKGWIKVQGYSEHAYEFFESSSECTFRVGDEEKNFELVDIEPLDNAYNFAIKLKGIDTIDGADMFKGFEIIVPLEIARKIENESAQSSYIGWKAIFSNGTEGVVSEMFDSASGEFVKVQIASLDTRKKEILVPLNDDFISEIDSEQKVMKIFRIECPYDF